MSGKIKIGDVVTIIPGRGWIHQIRCRWLGKPLLVDGVSPACKSWRNLRSIESGRPLRPHKGNSWWDFSVDDLLVDEFLTTVYHENKKTKDNSGLADARTNINRTTKAKKRKVI